MVLFLIGDGQSRQAIHFPIRILMDVEKTSKPVITSIFDSLPVSKEAVANVVPVRPYTHASYR